MVKVIRSGKNTYRIYTPPPWWKRWKGPPIRLLIVAAMIGGVGVKLYLDHGLPSFSLASFDSAAREQTISESFILCGLVRRTCVVDGDTIWLDRVKIRLLGIDAPEISEPKCTSEKALGLRAKARLLEWLNEGPFVVAANGGRDEDVYGRKLRDLKRDGRSVGDVLISEGLAAPWEGQHHYWCG